MEMRKVVINDCFGGFGLSIECAAACGIEITPVCHEIGYVPSPDIARDCGALVAFIEHYGYIAAGGRHTNLVIVEIPMDVKWHIAEYDGLEHVAEDHRTWYASRD